MNVSTRDYAEGMVLNSDLDAVKRIVESFERSDWQEIDVRWGDLRVHLASTTSRLASTTKPVSARSTAPTDVEPEVDTAEATHAAPLSIPPGAHVVTSPSPGIFWRASEPGAPPFTDIGQTVEPAATLCIIEVMKLMHHVKAGVDGQVVAIYVKNGAAVAKEEPLFAVVVAEGTTS